MQGWKTDRLPSATRARYISTTALPSMWNLLLFGAKDLVAETRYTRSEKWQRNKMAKRAIKSWIETELQKRQDIDRMADEQSLLGNFGVKNPRIMILIKLM